MTALTFCMVLAGVLLNAGAQLALKAGTNQIGAFNFSAENIVPIGWKIATNPYIFLGLSCYVVSVVVWILALSRVPVSIAYPMLSIGYVVAAAGTPRAFNNACVFMQQFSLQPMDSTWRDC